MKQKSINQIVQSYLGMTPIDMGCENWTEMQSKMEEEINEAISSEKQKYSKKDMIEAYVQGAKDYCSSPKHIDAFLSEDVYKWNKENLK